MPKRKNTEWVNQDEFFKFRLPSELLRQFEKCAMEQGLSVSAWVRMVLIAHMKTRHKKVTFTHHMQQ